jgi:hypothetical protein
MEALLAVAALSGVGASFARAARFYAPFAFLPVGKPVTIPVPPAAGAALMRHPAAVVTYRSGAPARALLSQLPGDPDVEVGDLRLQFDPQRGWVTAARPSWRKPSLVRVDVRSVEGAFVLRAKELPDLVLWLPALLVVVWLRWPPAPTFLPILLGGLGGLVVSLFQRRADAARSFDVVVAEMKKRIDALSDGG